MFKFILFDFKCKNANMDFKKVKLQKSDIAIEIDFQIEQCLILRALKLILLIQKIIDFKINLRNLAF